MLEANYDPKHHKVFLGIYSEDPYRIKFEKQKLTVDKLTDEIKSTLETVAADLSSKYAK